MDDDKKQPTLFLSYAHGDRARAQQVAAALIARGYTLWWDELIEGGAQFSRSIRDALEAADAVVVLWSATSIESDWVQDEAAQGRDRKRLVPVSLDGSVPPLGFRQYQTIDLGGTRGKPGAAKIEAIDRAIRAAVAGSGRAPVVSRGGTTRRGALALGAGAVALAGGGAIYAWRDDLFGGDADERTIAVLPFKNLGGDPDQAFLSEGMTEEVRAGLARNPGLRVLAAVTSASIKDNAAGATRIADRLGVAHLLEGSVQRAGDMVRVAIDLTDGATGFSTWSRRFDGELSDVFAFESEIARTVSEALSVRMATMDPAPGGTRVVAAYEAYLRGKSLYNQAKDEATDRAALSYYEVALAADPNFALAHAALARVLASIAANNADAGELKALYARALAEAEKAINIEPRLAEGQLAYGYAQFAGRLDIKAARPAYDKAAKLGARNAEILLLCSLFQARSRRFSEAREAIGRALVLDPLNARTWRAAGSIDYAARQPKQAVARFNKSLSLNPAMSTANASMAYALIELKRYDEARAALDKESNAMFRLTGQAIVADKSGDRRLADTSMAELIREIGDAGLYQQAQVLAQWGRTGDALDRLERARAIGDSGLISLTTDPFLDPLLKEPRYRALVRSMGLV